MNFKLRNANKLVALFLLAAVIIVLATMVFTGDITDLFSQKYFFTSVFDDTIGLSPGLPVKLKDLNIEIGKVETVESGNIKGQIKVKYSVLRNYVDTYLKRDTVAFFESPVIPIIGGDTVLTLTIGEDSKNLIPLHNKTHKPLINKLYIPSNQTNEGKVILSKNYYKEEGENPINSIINNIDSLTAEISRPEGSVQQTLANIEEITNPAKSELLRTTNDLIKSLADLMDKVNEGDVGDLLGEPIYKEVLSILEEIQLTIEDVRKGTIVSINDVIEEQNANITSLLNDSIKSILDSDVKNLINNEVGPAISQVSNSVEDVTNQIETLLITINGFVNNSTTAVNELINRTTERVNLITEEVSDSILTTLTDVTGTISELEETLLSQITSLLDELTTTISENVNPAIGEITEDIVSSIDIITKGLTETVYELQLVIGQEAKDIIKNISSNIESILNTLDEISKTAGNILEETAPDIAEAIKSLTLTLKGLPDLIDSLSLVLDTADLTLKRIDLVLERLDSILAGMSGDESFPIPGRTGQGSQRGGG